MTQRHREGFTQSAAGFAQNANINVESFMYDREQLKNQLINQIQHVFGIVEYSGDSAWSVTKKLKNSLANIGRI